MKSFLLEIQIAYENVSKINHFLYSRHFSVRRVTWFHLACWPGSRGLIRRVGPGHVVSFGVLARSVIGRRGLSRDHVTLMGIPCEFLIRLFTSDEGGPIFVLEYL